MVKIKPKQMAKIKPININKFKPINVDKTTKFCYLPTCSSSIISTPSKTFFSIPRSPRRRAQWCRIMEVEMAHSSSIYLCEDHFDLENDTSNYIRHKLMGTTLRLKEDVVPSRFVCRHLFDDAQNPDDDHDLQILKREMIDKQVEDIMAKFSPNNEMDTNEKQAKMMTQKFLVCKSAARKASTRKGNKPLGQFKRGFKANVKDEHAAVALSCAPSTEGGSYLCIDGDTAELLVVGDPSVCYFDHHDYDKIIQCKIEPPDDLDSSSASHLHADLPSDQDEMMPEQPVDAKDKALLEGPVKIKNEPTEPVNSFSGDGGEKSPVCGDGPEVYEVPVIPEDHNYSAANCEQEICGKNQHTLGTGEQIKKNKLSDNKNMGKSKKKQVNAIREKYYGKPESAKEVFIRPVKGKCDASTQYEVNPNNKSYTTLFSAVLNDEANVGIQARYCNKDTTKKEDKGYRKEMLQTTLRAIEDDPEFFIGIPKDKMILISHLFSKTKISKINLYIVFRKLKLNESHKVLAAHFNMETSAVLETLQTCVPRIAACMREIIYFPSKEQVSKCKPAAFVEQFQDVQAILNNFIIQISIGKDSRENMKMNYLITSTPDGLISFVSRGVMSLRKYPRIFESPGFKELMSDAATFIADEDFPLVDSQLASHGCTLLRIAHSTQNPKQFQHSMHFMTLREHIDYIMKIMRSFDAFLPHHCFEFMYRKLVDDIIIIVCGLINVLTSKVELSQTMPCSIRNVDK